MTANPILTAEWLRQKHVDQGVRIADLAAAAKCSTTAVRSALDRFGIERRDDRGGRHIHIRRATFDIIEARRLYEKEAMACVDIGEALGVNGSTVLRRLKEAGVHIRHHNDTKRGAKAKNRIDLDPAAVVGRYREQGATGRSVSAEFGVSPQVIFRVLAELGEPVKEPDFVRPTGPEHPSWRHDLSADERANRRDNHQQAKWRKRVYERDGYVCQCCADKSGGNLNAHHVLAHATNPADRWNVDNGVTLCAPCHRAFHSAYGLTGVDRAMLDDFIAARSRPMAA